MKTVSVIVPIYNTAEYLSECIESIINQTLHDIEIILVNDGSTDGSDKAAQDYADKYSNIILINQQNAGLSAARNRGLAAALGKYVYFIDSDDLLEKTALENLYRISEQERLDILYFAAQTFYESDSLKKRYKNFDNQYLRKGVYLDAVNGKELLAAMHCNADYIVSACLQFIRREYLAENGFRFYEGILHEDNLFTFATIMKAERASCINDIYYYRRIRSNSIMTQKKTAANLRGYYISLIEHVKIADNADCTEEQHEVVLRIIQSLAGSVKRIYCEIDAWEIDKFLKECPIGSRYLFEGVFITYIDELHRLNGVVRNTKTAEAEQKRCGEIAELYENSISFRIGRMITWLPRKIKSWISGGGAEGKMKNKVSVIVPVYNMEEYVQECLDTIMRQSLRDIEIICVNDGSTDNSEQAVRASMEKDERIKLINKENGGAGSARNAALEAAEGEYVIFIDPDDVYPSDDILEVLYKKAKENNVFICGGSFSEFSEEKGLVTEFEGIRKKYKFNKEGLVYYKDYQFDYGYHRFIYQLEFLKKNNIFFPPYLRYQDPPFFVKAMVKAEKFYAVEKIVYQYRAGYKSVNWNERKLMDLLRGLRDNLKISGEENLDELHITTIKRLGKNYKDMYAAHIKECSPEFTRLLFEIDALVKRELLKLHKDGKDYMDVVPDIFKRAVEMERLKAEKDLRKCRQLVNLIENSKSYKIGRMLTFGPRKIRLLLGR